MSAVINWDFAVERWTDTIREVYYTQGPKEADDRTEHLPKLFKARLLARLQGEDIDGGEY